MKGKLNRGVAESLRQFKEAGGDLVDELANQGRYGSMIVDESTQDDVLTADVRELDHVSKTCTGLSLTLEEMVKHFAMETEGHLRELNDLLKRLDTQEGTWQE